MYSIHDSATGYTYVYTYDSIGRLIASCVKSGATVLMQTRQEYNSNNQLTAQHWTVGDTTYSETYSYNKTEGTLSSMTTGNGHTISLTYDNLRRVSKVDTGTLDRYYTYRTVTGTDGTTTSQVSQLRYGGDTTSYFTYDYTYDVLGNIATYKQNGTTWTYTYDKQSQLKTATSGSTTYSYSYDNAGNITAANGKSYTYGNTVWRDLLTKYDGQYIAYEGQTVSGSTVSGNPTSGNPISYYNGTRWTFDWEEGRNLVSADSTSASVDYTYDQNGLRVSKTVDGVKHTYLYASGKLLRESYGNVVLDFFYDQNGYPYAMTYKNGTAAAVTYYYITNLQGDVLTMITSSGTSVASYTYDPYGKPLTATGTMAAINPLRYRGYYYDTETGFYYLQSRYYDPAICRFINADSYASTGQGVLGNNMFAYCLNNPASMRDNDGCLALSPLGMLIGGAVGYVAGMILADILGLEGVERVLFVTGFAVSGMLLGGVLGPYVAKLLALVEAKLAQTIVIESWKAAEEWLQKKYDGVKKLIETPFGRREVDCLTGMTARESKYGYQGLSSFIKQEIAKDKFLISIGYTVEWHFFWSQHSNSGGPSTPLREELIKAGIKIVEHFTGG